MIFISSTKEHVKNHYSLLDIPIVIFKLVLDIFCIARLQFKVYKTRVLPVWHQCAYLVLCIKQEVFKHLPVAPTDSADVVFISYCARLALVLKHCSFKELQKCPNHKFGKLIQHFVHTLFFFFSLSLTYGDTQRNNLMLIHCFEQVFYLKI